MIALDNLYNFFEKLYALDNFILLMTLLSLIGLMTIALSFIITKRFDFKGTVKKTKDNIQIQFQRLDDKARTELITSLKFASSESNYTTKLKLFQMVNLRFVERSNIRAYIPFFNVYILVIIVISIFFLLIFPFYSIFKTWKTAFVLSAFISMIPIIFLDTLSSFTASKTRKNTADFLSILLGWLSVKNDLLFALEKTSEEVDAPLRYYVKDAVAQIKNGMTPQEAFDIMSYQVNTDQFYTIAKSFKSVLVYGGNIIDLVDGLEEEAFMVDNEMTTRITDTFTSRMLLLLLLVGATLFMMGSLFSSESLRELYTNTTGGQNIMFFAIVAFIAGILGNLKINSKVEE